MRESPRDIAATLTSDLTDAYAAATENARREPLGVRAVELPTAHRSYLCAFDGPAFLCLDVHLAPVTRTQAVRDIASAGLLWENVETLIDAERLRELAGAVGGALALPDLPQPVDESLATLAERALTLARWREAPQRIVASIPALDDLSATHERLRAAWGLFVRATDPLVAIQTRLDPIVIERLRAVEQAAGDAHVPQRFAELLAAFMPECGEDAEQIVTCHLTPLNAS